MTGAPGADCAPVLVSACLLGEPCRYDGASAPCAAALRLAERAEVVPVCPERLGGLPVPRTPAERTADGGVVDARGRDVTEQFCRGAQEAVRLARDAGCRRAVLKSKSPSCGVYQVYDGTFTGTLVPGAGVCAEMLARAGLEVIDEHDLEALG